MSDETLFAKAVGISDPVERAAFLDRECAGNRDQRREIEELLAAHQNAGSFLKKPDITSSYEPGANGSPKAVGPYKLLQKIGEGGMGAVYMAEQEEPVRRRVALKIIKAGMDSERVIARFEAERQALAMMDHPNIARVLDAGTTPDGRPYFVMELVKGVPITKFCDDNKLTPRERLELFIPICQAIQHAHQKGVIHRDIKPSNVLVTLYDGKPVPKVIDFGIAKATAQKLTERTLFTEFGALIGTPEYMSPEQAEMNALDIDTRSDVYALGVLLYELLTGSTPIDRKSIRDAGYSEMLRLIREVEPPRPSARISGSREATATISEQRKTDAAKLSKLMKGELDWIVMKALEKDRNRRYETANGFARDVQRYLAGDAVEACPPTLGYRLRKAYRKNRAAILTTAAFALLLISGTVFSAWQATRASVAEVGEKTQRLQAETNLETAITETNKAIKSQADALAAQKRAEEEKRNADAALDYYGTGLLSHASPVKGGDPNIKLRTVVDILAANLKTGKKQPPLVEAAIRHTLGTIYLNLERYEEARDHFQEAHAIRKGELTAEHPDTIRSLIHLGDPELWREEKAAAGNDAAETDGERFAVEGWGLAKRVLGSNDLTTLIAARNVARYHQWAQRYHQAEALYLETLKGFQAPGGSESWAITVHIDLAWHYNRRRIWDEAERYAKQAVELRRALHKTDDHYLCYLALEVLANVYGAQGRYAEAESLFRQVIDGFHRHVGPKSFSYLYARTGLGFGLNRQGKHQEAVKEFEQSINDLRVVVASVPSLRQQFAFNLTGYGDSLNKLERFKEAREVLEEAQIVRKPAPRPVGSTTSILGETYIGLKDYPAAEQHLLAAYKFETERYTLDSEWRSPEFRQRTLERLIKLYEAWDKPGEAAKWRAEYEKWIHIAPPPHEVKPR